MGSLAGHLIPGSFFVIYGVFWCMNFIWYHNKTKPDSRGREGGGGGGGGEFRKKKERQSQSASSSFFELRRHYDLTHKSWIPITWTRVPVEPILKILLPVMGIIVETFFDDRHEDVSVEEVVEEEKRHLVMSVYSVRNTDGVLNDIGKLHHITMYGGFMLSGIVDLLSICLRFPRQTSMLFLTLAFTVEALLFCLHTLGRDTLNVEVHFLLLLSILSCVVFTFLRNFHAANVVVNLGVGNSILLQGAWFMQAGYFLFGGFVKESTGSSSSSGVSDDELRHRYLMFVSACFTWNLFAVAVGNLVLWVAMSACLRSRLLHRRTFRKRTLLSSLKQGLVHVGTSGQGGGGGGAGAGAGGGVEERDRLIVEEENDGSKNEVEMKLLADTHT